MAIAQFLSKDYSCAMAYDLGKHQYFARSCITSETSVGFQYPVGQEPDQP
jgi:hypothetical protein